MYHPKQCRVLKATAIFSASPRCLSWSSGVNLFLLILPSKYSLLYRIHIMNCSKLWTKCS